MVKGVQMEGLRVLGNPADFARRYSRSGWELYYVDIVASLYGRNHFEELLDETTHDIHIPVTVAGGIRSYADAARLLKAGADRVAVCTAAITNPDLIDEIAGSTGSQAITVEIAAKRRDGGWEAYTDGGRERSGRDALALAREAVRRGAGEIMLTSVDMEGTKRGFDCELIAALARELPVPVIAGGGCGALDHIRAARAAGADGVSVASCLHYGILTQEQIESGLKERAPECPSARPGRSFYFF